MATKRPGLPAMKEPPLRTLAEAVWGVENATAGMAKALRVNKRTARRWMQKPETMSEQARADLLRFCEGYVEHAKQSIDGLLAAIEATQPKEKQDG